MPQHYTLHRDMFITQERHQCREVVLIVFGFLLRDEQVDTIYCEKINWSKGKSLEKLSSNLVWGLKGKRVDKKSFITKKGEDRGDESLNVGDYQADASMAKKLLASALRFLSLVWSIVGYCLLYSDGR